MILIKIIILAICGPILSNITSILCFLTQEIYLEDLKTPNINSNGVKVTFWGTICLQRKAIFNWYIQLALQSEISLNIHLQIQHNWLQTRNHLAPGRFPLPWIETPLKSQHHLHCQHHHRLSLSDLEVIIQY